MKSTHGSFLRRCLLMFFILLVITLPLCATCARSLSDADVQEWKMWLNLAKNGYAEPMLMKRKEEKPWWRFWD